MKRIIDIPDNYDLSKIQNGSVASKILLNCIKNGTPLPKGHGNIYDENDIKREIENLYQCQTVLNGLKLVKPIIEADKAESEEV